MKSLKSLLIIVLVMVFMNSAILVAGEPLISNTVVSQSSAQIKKLIPALLKPDVKKALAIAEKYYKLAISKATTHEKSYLSLIINWKPDFTGKSKNVARAVQYLNSSAYLTSYTDLKWIYLPLTAAVFACDSSNSTAAGNLASAIAAYSEDKTGKPIGIAILSIKEAKPYADDAAAVYEYALALKLTSPTINLGAMPLLLNYGYLSIDCNKLERAKLIFETAMKMSPGYLPAAEGMAAYWMAKGDKDKAKKVLDNNNLSVMHRKAQQGKEDVTEKKTPNVQYGESPENMLNKLKNMAKVETVLATDFYEDLDPAGAQAARRFVSSLRNSINYKTIDFSYLSQYSTLKNFQTGGGQAAYDAFTTERMGLEEKVAAKQLSEAEIDELENELDQMEANTDGSPEDLANKFAQMGMVSKLSPEMLVLVMKPGDYANPTDILAQQYNVLMLKKIHMGYQIYLQKQIEELRKVVEPAQEELSKKLEPLRHAMGDELEQLVEEHDASHDKSSSICDACIVKTHAIHQKYDSQMNNLAETRWMDVTNFANSRYMQKIKPNIEAMYVECEKHILLISDPAVRLQTEENLKKEIDQWLCTILYFVDRAYALDPGGYPFECDCSTSEVEAALERQRKVEEAIDSQRTAMENKARKAFEEGVIPENSQLYDRLDKYTQSYQLMFMKAKWHPLKTELTFDVKLPTLGPDLSFKMTQNHMRNTTTYGGGVMSSMGKASGAGGALSASASLGAQGYMTLDGNGNIVDYDYAGIAQGKLSAGFLEAGGAFELSPRRGCKLSGEVAKIYSELVGTPEEMDAFMPEKPRKVLWQGEYEVKK